MSMIEPVLATSLYLSIPFLLLFSVFMVLRGDLLLLFFQQEEYDINRFVSWWKNARAFDVTLSVWTLVALLTSIVSLTVDTLETLANTARFITPILIAVGLGCASLKSYRFTKKSKKPLVKTMRAKRILFVYYGLTLTAVFIALYFTGTAPSGSRYSLAVDRSGLSVGSSNYDATGLYLAIFTLCIAQALPFLLMAANKILEPFETRIKARYRVEAEQILQKMTPKIIAITGSFGKTSTKHILGHILEVAAPTLMTPGSINTEMGITRIIRERLRPEHQYFIVEMGAYGPGSIARLCTLTPPDVGLITSVGAAHYERFKSLETVARAKFELAEAVGKRGGTAIIQKDAIHSTLLHEQLKILGPDAQITLVGLDGDIKISDIKQDTSGLSFTVTDKHTSETLFMPLFGRHQAENAALAATAARAIGVPWAVIKGALKTTPQIRHRLEVSDIPDGPKLIDDAYNSNPVGFAAALECLDILRSDNGRRILVTPGIVELGHEHDPIHKKLGKLAAQHCEIVAAVTPQRILSFIEAFEENKQESARLIRFATQEDAEHWVKSEWKEGDAVLFENNLPDLYETKVRL